MYKTYLLDFCSLPNSMKHSLKQPSLTMPFLADKTHTLQAGADDTVQDVKAQIAALQGVPAI